MFFIEKNAPDATEKLQTSINTNKPASRVRFISKAIKPVTGRKCFQCALRCDRLQFVLINFTESSLVNNVFRIRHSIFYLGEFPGVELFDDDPPERIDGLGVVSIALRMHAFLLSLM